MTWVIRTKKMTRTGIDYHEHKFPTKKEAERFREGLICESEIYKVTKMKGF